MKQFQTLIRCTQWAISLGRHDVFCATMSVGRFRSAPEVGHLQRLKRVCGHLKKHPEGAIRFRTEIPDCSHLERVTHNWTCSVHGKSKEEVPSDTPLPRGKSARTPEFEDANLMQDLAAGRSVTGVLHPVNSAPAGWFCEVQGSVETATCGSEFLAARLATEQSMDVCCTLRSLGAPHGGKAHMFGDNANVITSLTIPHSSLNKRHNALSHHRVHEAIAPDILWFFHVPGKVNPADVLAKFCGHSVFWPLIKPCIFWHEKPSKFPFEPADIKNVEQAPHHTQRGVSRGTLVSVLPNAQALCLCHNESLAL
jgi:hypothetical protein